MLNQGHMGGQAQVSTPEEVFWSFHLVTLLNGMPCRKLGISIFLSVCPKRCVWAPL